MTCEPCATQTTETAINPSVAREIGYYEAVIYTELVREFQDQIAYYQYLDEGWFHIPQEQLAYETGWSERYVRKKIQRLKRYGLIERKNLYGDNALYYRLPSR